MGFESLMLQCYDKKEPFVYQSAVHQGHKFLLCQIALYVIGGHILYRDVGGLGLSRLDGKHEVQMLPQWYSIQFNMTISSGYDAFGLLGSVIDSNRTSDVQA